MLKKSLSILLFLCLTLFISNITYATADVVMDLNNPTSNGAVDNTIYTPSVDDTTTEGNSDFEFVTPSTSVQPDYDNSGDGLSIGNMINIILIVVGVVLILLGIAIILKLK